MPYIIILKVRKFHQSTRNRFGTAGKKPVGGCPSKVDDKRKRYINPITLNYVLRPTYLAALHKIKKNNQEWQHKLETFEEVYHKR